MTNSRQHWRKRQSGMTLIEVLVVLLILMVLLAMLFPAYQKVSGNGAELRCASNLRQLGVAFTNYSNDNSGYLLPVLTVRRNPNTGSTDSIPWNRLLLVDGYLPWHPNWVQDRQSVFSCPARSSPAWGGGDQLHYGYNHFPGLDTAADFVNGQMPKRYVNLASLSQTMLLAEIASAYRFVPSNLTITPGMTIVYPHRDSLNTLYADGSVRKLRGPLTSVPAAALPPQSPYY